MNFRSSFFDLFLVFTQDIVVILRHAASFKKAISKFTIFEQLPIRRLDKSALLKFISYFSTKIYVVGTQKNRLNETVLLSTQNNC